jgi:hypothetical protein
MCTNKTSILWSNNTCRTIWYFLFIFYSFSLKIPVIIHEWVTFSFEKHWHWKLVLVLTYLWTSSRPCYFLKFCGDSFVKENSIVPPILYISLEFWIKPGQSLAGGGSNWKIGATLVHRFFLSHMLTCCRLAYWFFSLLPWEPSFLSCQILIIHTNVC